MQDIKCVFCNSHLCRVVFQHHEKPVHETVSYQISEATVLKPERLIKCQSCDLVFADSLFAQDAVKEAYRTMDSDTDYIAEESGRRRNAQDILDCIKQVKPKAGHILDIGCSCGFLLDEARKGGWQTSGVELSEWACRYATETLGLPHIENKDFLETAFPEHTFDAIVFTDVLEHVADPKALLSEVKRILKPDGVLYMTFPYYDSWLRKILGFRWWGINFFHFYYFNKKTITHLLKQIGFNIRHIKSYPRYFSVDYMAHRLKALGGFGAKSAAFFLKLLFAKRKWVGIDTRDQLYVLATRTRTLDYVKEKELFDHTQYEASKARTDKKKVAAVLPAYNAAKTLEMTVHDISRDVVDDIILVDDCSPDNTYELAKELGVLAIQHETNTGYGGNQKTCYNAALQCGADIVVMVHPDYQYDPRAIADMVEPIASGRADVVMASRMMKGGALEGGMPLWKHNVNIILTAVANIIFHRGLTEYHSGFRAFSRDVLETISYRGNHDNFVFDFQMLAQIVAQHYRIEEIPIKTRYFDEASSIKIIPAMVYGLGILWVLAKYWLYRTWSAPFKEFK